MSESKKEQPYDSSRNLESVLLPHQLWPELDAARRRFLCNNISKFFVAYRIRASYSSTLFVFQTLHYSPLLQQACLELFFGSFASELAQNFLRKCFGNVSGLTG